jgi:uncharacterized membrane protein
MPPLKAIRGRPTAKDLRVFGFAHEENFMHCPEIQMALSLSNNRNALYWAIAAALGVAALVEILVPGFSAALDLTLIFLAAVASVLALNRQLPLQNVLSTAVITAFIGSVAHALSARMDIAMPFGPLTFGTNAGWKIFNAVPCTLPLIWIIAVFNSRGVGRMILRPWRKTRNYGFILIGVTAVLTLVFDLALEPFAAHVKHFWLWHPTRMQLNWHGASPLNFIGWLVVTLLILAFITPTLIKKQPGGSGGLDFHPVALWFGALLIFAVGAGTAGLWSAVIVDMIFALIVAVFCWRGARW